MGPSEQALKPTAWPPVYSSAGSLLTEAPIYPRGGHSSRNEYSRCRGRERLRQTAGPRVTHGAAGSLCAFMKRTEVALKEGWRTCSGPNGGDVATATGMDPGEQAGKATALLVDAGTGWLS